MGKTLIILGADFSENAIVTDEVKLYNTLFEEFLVGNGIITSYDVLTSVTNAARCSIFGVDMSEYQSLGYNHINVVFKEVGSHDFILGIGSTIDYRMYDKDGNIVTWDWQSSSSNLQGDFYGECKLFINFRKHNGSDFPSDFAFSDIVDYVELS